MPPEENVQDTGNNENNDQTNNTDDPAAAVAAAVEDNQPKFYYAEDVAGEGDAPEWFKADKYKTVDEQAKAYTELEKRFGGFSGAPEEYALNISDDLKEKGVEVAEDDPILAEAVEAAKSMNMSQEGFDKFMDIYMMTKVSETEALQQVREQEFAALGDKAQQRVDNLDRWAKANLPKELYDGFVNMATSAASVKALEQMVSLTRNAPVSPDGAHDASRLADEQRVREMQFEKDEHGNRRIQTDSAFKKEYEQLRDRVYGTEDHRVMIGGAR